MKLGIARRKRSLSLDDALLPLVNVVFLLMIFFLSSSHFGAPKPGRATPASQRADARATAAPRVLELREGAVLALADEVFADSQLAARALAWQGQPLDLRAAGEVPAERVLRLLATLREAGVSDVRLLTVRGGR